MSGTVLVADVRGQILERLALSWTRHHRALTNATLFTTIATNVWPIIRAGEDAGTLHWIDQLAFVAHGHAARVPQTVMVHHVVESAIARTVHRLRDADAITTSSHRWQRRIRELTGREAFLVPYSLDSTLFRPRDRSHSRASLGIDDSRFVIGFSARAQANAGRRKGIELFVEVAQAVASRWSGITILLIGGGWDAIADALRRDSIDVVRFVPERTEDTAPVYPAMDVFLCTASEEGGPCTILEAMSGEVPVVTTDVGHVPEVIRDGETGFVVARDPAAFLDRLQVLRDSPTLARQMGVEARRFIVAERENRVLVPRIDFDAIHADARLRYERRSRGELAMRSFARARRALRYAARRALR